MMTQRKKAEQQLLLSIAILSKMERKGNKMVLAKLS